MAATTRFLKALLFMMPIFLSMGTGRAQLFSAVRRGDSLLLPGGPRNDSVEVPPDAATTTPSTDPSLRSAAPSTPTTTPTPTGTPVPGTAPATTPLIPVTTPSTPAATTPTAATPAATLASPGDAPAGTLEDESTERYLADDFDAVPAAAPAVDPAVARSPCLLPRDVGICRASFERYYFNPQTARCEEFVYGGCRGNANNFLTLERCKQTCETPEIIQAATAIYAGSANPATTNTTAPAGNATATATPADDTTTELPTDSEPTDAAPTQPDEPTEPSDAESPAAEPSEPAPAQPQPTEPVPSPPAEPPAAPAPAPPAAATPTVTPAPEAGSATSAFASAVSVLATAAAAMVLVV